VIFIHEYFSIPVGQENSHMVARYGCTTVFCQLDVLFSKNYRVINTKELEVADTVNDYTIKQ